MCHEDIGSMLLQMRTHLQMSNQINNRRCCDQASMSDHPTRPTQHAVQVLETGLLILTAPFSLFSRGLDFSLVTKIVGSLLSVEGTHIFSILRPQQIGGEI